MKNLLRSVGLALLICAFAPALPACVGDAAETGDELDQTASTGKFETFTGEDGQRYFQLVAGNGERILRSQGYSSLANAKKGITSVRTNAKTAASFKVLQAEGGNWYFNLVAKNGQIIGTSETYVSKVNAQSAVDTVIKVAETATDASATVGSANFETFKGADSKTHFRLRAKNGEIVLQSQGYASKSGAEGGIESVKKNGVEAARYAVLDGLDGQSFFHLTAKNGQIIGRSEMYTTPFGAQRGADSVRASLREMTGAGAVPDADVKLSIETAAQDLLFMSESDFPFTYVQADLAAGQTDITEAIVREKLGALVDADPAADKPMTSLFSMSDTWTEWKASDAGCADAENDPDAKVLCDKMRNLDHVLESNLTGLKVFYFGGHGKAGQVDGIGVSLFIVGRTPSGKLAGVRTIAIWT